VTEFADFPYQRPDIEQVRVDFQRELAAFASATSAEAQFESMAAISALSAHFDSMAQIAQIRYSINTTDAFYKGEADFFDEAGPQYQELVSDYYRALVQAKFRKELEARHGSQLFQIAELSLRTFSPEVIGDLQQENRLSTEYTQLMASAQIPFDGKTLTLSQLSPYLQSTDRTVRKSAALARYGFMAEHEAEFDLIYDNLVQLRTRIAHKLGFASFVELGYARMQRTDYDRRMVEGFRRQVQETIVPFVGDLQEARRQRLGLDHLYYYDTLMYPQGNPTPKGDPDWILAQGRRMYDELSPETSEFFHYMETAHLFDVHSRTGKAPGGYCTYVPDQQAPFIFANMNGTSGDVDVLTHEAGHAFQVYCSRHFDVPEYHFPTMESAEIHSMSMEFFTWPWMELFFQEDTMRYRYRHLAGALSFIPYGVAVDEFQHVVYERPELTPAQRKAAWREIERKYVPDIDYEDNQYLEGGAYWHQQGHIFASPFYYIDYTLAQICALQFWGRAQHDRESAWTDYVNLCRLGGSLSFTRLVAAAKLESPFADGCVQHAVNEVTAWLGKVSETQLA